MLKLAFLLIVHEFNRQTNHVWVGGQSSSVGFIIFCNWAYEVQLLFIS